MGQKNNKNTTRLADIRFSIGFKLIIIISCIVILSLGSITALVSWLVRGDIKVSAEESNFESNRHAALEAEMTLVNVLSSSRLLLEMLDTDMAGEQNRVNFFFNQNPLIVSVLVLVADRPEYLLVNDNYFKSREADVSLTDTYFINQKAALGRALRGETLLLNATPHFSLPLMSIFFPLQNGGIGCVLFSSDELNQNFGFGTNKSFMINSDSDVLSHGDYSLVRKAVNYSEEDYIKAIMESPQRNRQDLIVTDSVRMYSAFTKLNTAGAVVITNIEYEKIFEGINATTRRNLYLTLAVLSISAIFIWFFSKTISIPLKALTVIARNIEGGLFKMELKSKRNDEIGVLIKSFRLMCDALNIFGRFTNKEIAVKAMRGEIRPGGLLKHATIFFSDIRDFTASSENFTKAYGKEASDRIIHWLNNYFTKMIECVEKTNGVVDKFIGDAVMAHWGTVYTDGSPEKDAFNCVKAALMMRFALYNLNKDRDLTDQANPFIRIGCGINTGIVTAGQLGSDMRMEYTVIGDPVNLASRIESLTKPLCTDILISENTWNLIGDKFITHEMPSVRVKGKEKPLRLFAIINLAGSTKGPQTIEDLRRILGLEAPQLSGVDINSDEKKYKIGND